MTTTKRRLSAAEQRDKDQRDYAFPMGLGEGALRQRMDVRRESSAWVEPMSGAEFARRFAGNGSAYRALWSAKCEPGTAYWFALPTGDAYMPELRYHVTARLLDA